MTARAQAMAKLTAAYSKPVVKPINIHGCIVMDCSIPRWGDSGFCKPHKQEHNRSPWVKAFRKEQNG